MTAKYWWANDYQYKPDLEAYFARIGYVGSREPTEQTLKDIQWNHLLSIPFEVLDIHTIGGPIKLEPDLIEDKLVHRKRGGYCFENNIYLMHVLREVGFEVVPILSRTRWMKPLDVANPMTHLVLKVRIDGRWWLFDVGFSSNGSAAPLLIESEEIQQTPLEPRRILKTEEFYVHQMFSGDKWHDIYSFTLQRSYPYDWEVGSYYVSMYMNAPPVMAIIVSKPTVSCRYLLLDKTLTIRDVKGNVTDTRVVYSEKEYRDILSQYFGINLSDDVTVTVPNAPW